MRLLNTITLETKQFMSCPDEPYTILSHRWGKAEVNFQEFQSAKYAGKDGTILPRASITTKSGYRKIQKCCERSLEDGYEWTWVDTCCIDKTSSSELSESINSMFQWYQNAGRCYIFLDDVDTSRPDADPQRQLRQSTWFTRGWTLQELIAPKRLFMFDAMWEDLGELNEGSALLGAVSEIAGIPPKFFRPNSIYSASVAMRMSWAAKRQTSKPEDMAYCLLGIFNVNMPLLYGEGKEKAFIRLQEEIIKSNHDQTIFAWHCSDFSSALGESADVGILAKSPANFQHSGNIVPSIRDRNSGPTPFEMTNLGIKIRLPFWQGAEDGVYWGVLDCHQVGKPERRVKLRFGSSWAIPRQPNHVASIMMLFSMMFLDSDLDLENLSSLYRVFEQGPIKDGASMYRQNGALMFEDVIQSSSEPWYFHAIRSIHTKVLSDELPWAYKSSEVLISQARTSRMPMTRIRFVFPLGYTCSLLTSFNPGLKMRLISEHVILFVMTGEEAEGAGRKDIYIALEEVDSPEYRSWWKPHSRYLLTSFHWESGQQSYRLLMSSGPLKRHGKSTPKELHDHQERKGRPQLIYWGKQYNSSISNRDPDTVRFEVEEQSIIPDSFELVSSLSLGLCVACFFVYIVLKEAFRNLLKLVSISGGEQILLACSFTLLISFCLFTPRVNSFGLILALAFVTACLFHSTVSAKRSN